METILSYLLNLPPWAAYMMILGVLFACGMGVPIPEDITLFAGGIASYYGVTNVFAVIAVAFFGVMVGDTFVFFMGRKYGRSVTQLKFFAKALPPKRLDLVERRFNQYGNKIIFAARFMPGLRVPVFFSAGTLRLPFRTFFGYDGLAAMLSVPTLVYLPFHFGKDIEYIVGVLRSVQHGIVAVIVGIILFVIGKWYLSLQIAARNKSK